MNRYINLSKSNHIQIAAELTSSARHGGDELEGPRGLTRQSLGTTTTQQQQHKKKITKQTQV